MSFISQIKSFLYFFYYEKQSFTYMEVLIKEHCSMNESATAKNKLLIFDNVLTELALFVFLYNFQPNIFKTKIDVGRSV